MLMKKPKTWLINTRLPGTLFAPWIKLFYKVRAIKPVNAISVSEDRIVYTLESLTKIFASDSDFYCGVYLFEEFTWLWILKQLSLTNSKPIEQILQELNDRHTKQSLTHVSWQIKVKWFKKLSFEHLTQIIAEVHSMHRGLQLSQSSVEAL